MRRRLLLVSLSFIAISVAFVGISSLPSLTPGARAQSPTTCEAQVGHAHGHLDFLHKIGDPANSGRSSTGFGFVTFGTADDAKFAGLLLVRGGLPAVYLVERGTCSSDEGRLTLLVGFRSPRTGETIEVTATTMEVVDGPGRYEAEVSTSDGGTATGGVIVLHDRPF